MSARRFWSSIIKKTSRTNKSSSPSMKKASHSTAEEDSDEEKEVVDQRRGKNVSPTSSGSKEKSVVSGIDLKVKTGSSRAISRRVKSMPRPKDRGNVSSPTEKQSGFTSWLTDDSSPEAAPNRRLKPRSTLPPNAVQTRVQQQQDAQDDYTDPEDATGEREPMGERDGDGEGEYSEPWQNERQGKRMVINSVKSPVSDMAFERLNGTCDEPSDLKRKSGSANGVKTEGHPTSGVSTTGIEASAASDYADPWDRLPQSKFPQRVKSTNKSPNAGRKARAAVAADDYDEPSNQKRLNEEGVVVGGDRKSQIKLQTNSTGDYDDPWDSHLPKPSVSSLKPPKPKPRPKPRSVGSDDYEDPWDNKSKPRSIPGEDYDDPWDGKGATSKSARPRPPTCPVPARPVEKLSSPEVKEKPKLTERVRPYRLDRKQSSIDESVLAESGAASVFIDTCLPLAKQTWFHGAISRAEADKILRVALDSSFLVRVSESNKDDHSLSIRRSGDIVHLKIARKNEKFILGLHGKPHRTIPDLIKHYTEHKVPIKGLESFTLLYPVKRN